MKTRGRPRHPDVLTPREWEVLTLVRDGLTNPQIAERMGITLDAAKYHVSEILSKLHLGSREEAAAWQPEPAPVAVLRPSWANALFRWWPLFGPVAGAGVMVAAVAGLGVLAYGVIKSESADETSAGAAPSATTAPGRAVRTDAERIVAGGGLESYAVTESGTMLTVWGGPACDFPNCEWAWRLGSDLQAEATGLMNPGDGPVDVIAAGDGFIVTPASNGDPGIRIALDGTATPLTGDCLDATWSIPTEPGRFVWTVGLYFVDTVTGVICDTGRLGGRTLARGVFTSDGALWALVDNETDPETLTIGRFDGVEWAYHDFAGQGGSWTSVIAAAGSTVVVLQVSPDTSSRPNQLVGFAVTTDDGATWSEVLDPDVLKRDLPFSVYGSSAFADVHQRIAAFAGTSALYVADGQGGLWRTADFVTFSRVPIPGGRVNDVRSTGDAVIVRVAENDLVRISADGTVEPITAR